MTTSVLVENVSGEEKFDRVGLWVLVHIKWVINDGVEALLELCEVAFEEVGRKLERLAFILQSLRELKESELVTGVF